MTTRNRLVMPPMVLNYADTQGCATDRYVAHIERIARGGTGTLILEASFVSQDGKGFANQLGVHSDSTLPGLRRLVEVAHRHGARIGPQLYHAGRQSSSRITNMPLLAPSALPCPLMQEVPQAMTAEDIDRVVAAFAAAARRARDAGFDFVELHGAHGYLLMQFLSGFSNHRDDAYGGSLENRLRFSLRILAAVREAVGDDFPVFYRISGEEGTPGGLTLAESTQAARDLVAAGVDAVHVSVGSYGSYVEGRMISPMAIPDAPNVDLAGAVREAIDKPVIAVGKCRTPAVAEKVLAEGKADFVAIGRALLADPDWPEKAASGRAHEINRCTSCNQGCISRLFEQHDAWCTVNPETGREIEFSRVPSRARDTRILVVGGGPAGMTAARIAAAKGASVVLLEREKTLGGQLPAAAAAPLRGDWRFFQEWLEDELERNGVEVRTNHAASIETILAEKPDLVVMASGAVPVPARFANTGSIPLMEARDVLEGRVNASGRVLVAGGGCAGLQTAEYLAETGCKVTLVEAAGEIALDMPMDERHLALQRLHDKRVDIERDTRLLGIEPAGVQLRGPRGDVRLAVDGVVLCLGVAPEDSLVKDLMTANLPFALVGDARRPRRVTEAVAEAAIAVLHYLDANAS